jgi:hypothetical protein
MGHGPWKRGFHYTPRPVCVGAPISGPVFPPRRSRWAGTTEQFLRSMIMMKIVVCLAQKFLIYFTSFKISVIVLQEHLHKPFYS